MQEIAREASQLFVEQQQAVGLLIDEVGFRKKGRMSACVGRQYLGCIGKTENGQVAVAAGLSQGEHYAPIDMRLFMPKEWQGDGNRRKKCDIPKQEKHLSKPRMAKQIIADAVKNGVRFDYVNFDALYGNATDLLTYLDGQGLSFIGDVRSNFMLYFNGDIEEKCTVRKYVANLLDDDFQSMNIRNSTKGKLSAKFHYAKVNVLNTHNRWLDLILLVRKDADGKTKYSLSNMHDDHIKELAERQAQRVYVEQIFKEGKNLVGLGDYQIRGWHGFHNHMALCMMAMLLIAKVKMAYNKKKFTAPMVQKIFKACIRSKMDDPDVALNIIFEQNERYIRQLQKDGYFNDDS